MSDEGSCVTLIFYRINPQWWKEPALNLASAVAQMSNLTHCEISIGESVGGNGQTMAHVARVFNDSVGVELVERTGRDPQNVFIQLGCSKMAEHKIPVSEAPDHACMRHPEEWEGIFDAIISCHDPTSEIAKKWQYDAWDPSYWDTKSPLFESLVRQDLNEPSDQRVAIQTLHTIASS